MDPLEAAARALYECEKERSRLCSTVLTRAMGKTIDDHMEPWEECREIYLADARAALEAAVGAMGWPEIHAYQDEMRKGQDVCEDAGGFVMRGLGRLFGVRPKRDEVLTYQKAAKAMIEKAQIGR